MHYPFINYLVACLVACSAAAQQIVPNPETLNQASAFRFELSVSTRLFDQGLLLQDSPVCPTGTRADFRWLEENSQRRRREKQSSRIWESSSCRLSSPYVSVFEQDAIAVGAFSEVEEWMDINLIKDGARLASLIREESRIGPTSCVDNACSWIVVSSSATPTYFSCRSAPQFPIPQSCRPVLIEADSGPQMLAKAGLTFSGLEISYAVAPRPHAIGLFTPGAVVGPTIEIHSPKGTLSGDKLRSVITAFLAQPQLKLTESASQLTGAITATCAPRKSEINVNQWEMLRVLATLYQRGPEELDLQYELVYWVNEQNTDRNVDWHLPTTAQLKRMTDEIDRKLREALSKECPSVSWAGGSLSCRFDH